MWWEVGERFKSGGYIYIYTPMTGSSWQKPTQYCKTMILQLKINKILLHGSGISGSRV